MLSKPIHNFRVVYTCHKFTYEFHAIFYNRECFFRGKEFHSFLKGLRRKGIVFWEGCYSYSFIIKVWTTFIFTF